jgi:hypothetical protein
MRRFALLALVVLAGCGRNAVADVPPHLRKVDPFPLYELTDTRPTPSLYARVDTTGWACTVFMTSGGGRPMLGRNFDFHDEPALVLHHHPPGAYRSVSLVDISYLGVDRAHLDRVDDAGQLDDASRLPFDGMNEKGVAVAMAAVPDARTSDGRTTGSLGVMRRVLDRAASVDEAIAIFRRASIDFSGGPPLHYLVADASGAGAVIEYVEGRVHVITRGPEPFLAMTNFVLTGHRGGGDHRYRTAVDTLDATHGTMTPESTLDLLKATKQPITRWSAAYDLKARRVTIAMGQRYGGRRLTFSP